MDERASKLNALLNIRKLGFMPQLVLDVGAQDGTPELYEVFPDSTHLMLEPVLENEAALKAVVSKLRSATYIIAAASNKTGTGRLYVSPNHRQAGLTDDAAAADPKSPAYREVPTVALDDIVRRTQLKGPFLLKIDVDGAELLVLEGARETLQQVGVLVIEATIWGEQIHRIIDFMQKAGFIIYDIVDFLYRPKDGALWQVDLVFVPRDSFLLGQSGFN